MKLPAALRLPSRVGWRDHVIGALLALVYVAWLIPGARVLGFPRDEGIYFRAGADYFRWWHSLLERGREALQQGAIDGAFNINHEHPPLMKTLFGASEWLLHEKWRVFADASTAFRLPGMMSAGLAIWVTYLFGARAWSRRAGLVAALLFALMPRVFFHAHLACFDVPITAMWILCVYVHWRAQEKRTWGWAVAVGVAYGLCLATKHNAWVLPFVLVPHALFVDRHGIWRALRVGRVSIPASIVTMATVGPAVLYALWPWIWNDTMGRLQFWADFMTHHDYYNIEFLGKNYFGPPSPKSYLPVMVLATVPTITILLFLAGAIDRIGVGVRRLRAWAMTLAHRDPRDTPPRDPLETDLLLALSFCGCVSVFFLSKTPIFGGTKHWMPAYPVLALFAGRGFDLVTAAMHRALPALDDTKRRLAETALVACVTVAPLAVTAHSHPFGLSAYVPLVGGTAGGADMGLNRQFWGFTTQTAAAEYLNSKAPRGANVFVNDTTWDAWARMQEEGRVRGDLRVVGAPAEAMLSLVQHELHMNEVDYDIWIADGSDAPVYVVTHDDVPIVSIYGRR
ncbi:MAG TPA: glycosyltransferase family 39 protein [Polyangiaceae bacterium]|nr:glycosyltransferase family 39 protein [Polyangiaceae bacterium]